MGRTIKRASPIVDPVEPRVLPSGVTPLLGQPTSAGVVREVRAILGTVARTGDLGRANVRLDRLAASIASGSPGLAAAWQADLSMCRPHVPGSIDATRRRIIGDLRRFDRGWGAGPVGIGPVAPAPPGPVGPVVAPSLDSVTIRNATGLALTVTVHLEVPQVQKPWITRTIPAQGGTIQLFNFGSATDAFMTIDVARADGGQSPPPLDGLSLGQPMGGYNGTPFTISVFGSYFNVTQG